MGAEADRCEAVMEALLKELGKAFSGHAFRGGGGSGSVPECMYRKHDHIFYSVVEGKAIKAAPLHPFFEFHFPEVVTSRGPRLTPCPS
jgi:hypothetical protein